MLEGMGLSSVIRLGVLLVGTRVFFMEENVRVIACWCEG